MKSILMSIKPYCGFLIIAKGKGWDLEKYGLHEKTVEVRKGVPTSPDWDKKVALYFSKDKKSLARIPEEYRGDVAKLCGTVVGEFVCDRITELESEFWDDETYESIGEVWYDQDDGEREVSIFADNDFKDNKLCRKSCVSWEELREYIGTGIKTFYGLHISDLKIYEKPKELSEFVPPCPIRPNNCLECDFAIFEFEFFEGCERALTRPPQSWQFVEEL